MHVEQNNSLLKKIACKILQMHIIMLRTEERGGEMLVHFLNFAGINYIMTFSVHLSTFVLNTTNSGVSN